MQMNKKSNLKFAADGIENMVSSLWNQLWLDGQSYAGSYFAVEIKKYAMKVIVYCSLDQLYSDTQSLFNMLSA